MKRFTRSAHDRKFHIHGKTFQNLTGSRKQVYHHGTAYKTTGGLTKDLLFFNNKTNRIVSKKKHFSAKKEKRLLRHGYGTQKGKFGAVRIGKIGKRKMRGGSGYFADDLFKSQAASVASVDKI